MVDSYLTLSLIYTGLVIFFYMTIWYFISLVFKRADIADFAWGVGFVLASLVPVLLYGPTTRSFILIPLVTIWGVRLALHILSRLVKKEEDYRYAAWRKDWGKYFNLKSYYKIWLLQGFLMFLIVIPVIIGNTYNGLPLSTLELFGILIWGIGFFFEAVGDWQLQQHIKKHPGKIMTTGLWQYTRHPNYFGEVTQWWGLWVMVLAVPYGWLGIIGPLTITFLILKVSGIPMLEKKYESNKEFQRYKKKTSAFFPKFTNG